MAQHWPFLRLGPAPFLSSTLSLPLTQGSASIQQQLFQTVFNEYKHRLFDVSKHLQAIDHFDCPACWPHPHSVHVDGNMKLSTDDRDKEPFRQPYHEALFVSDEDVKANLRDLDDVLCMAPRRSQAEQACSCLPLAACCQHW